MARTVDRRNVNAIPGAAIGPTLYHLWWARVDREHGIDDGFTRRLTSTRGLVRKRAYTARNRTSLRG